MTSKKPLLISIAILLFLGFRLNAQEPSLNESAQSLFNEGEKLLKSGDLAKAIKKFNRASVRYKAIKDPVGELKSEGQYLRLLGALGDFKESNRRIDSLLNDNENTYKDSLFIGQFYLTKGKNFKHLGEIEEAAFWIRKAMDHMAQNKYHREYCSAHLYLGVIMWDSNDPNAQNHMEKTVSLFNQHFEPKDEMLGHPHQLLGAYKLHFGNVAEAKAHFSKAVEYFNYGSDKVAKANSTFYLGIANWNMKDFDMALERMEKAKTLFDEAYGPNQIRATFVNNLIGNVYTDLGKHDVAEEYFDLAYQVRKVKYGPKHLETIAMLMNKSNAQYNQGNYQTALTSQKKVAQLFEEAELKNYDYFKIYKNIGNTEAKLGNLDAARKAYEQSAKKGLQVLTPDAVQWIDLRLEQVKLSKSKDEAMRYYDLAFQVFELDEKIESIPSSKFDEISHPILLFQLMVDKLSYERQNHESQAHLDGIESTVKLMDRSLDLAGHIRLGQNNEGSQAQFYSLAKQLFHEYLDLTWLLKETKSDLAQSDQRINQIFEKSKAWILLDGLAEKGLETSYSIDETTKKKISDLNRNIDLRYQRITQIPETAFEEQSKIRTEIFDLRAQLIELQEEIRLDYPEYKIASPKQVADVSEISNYMQSKDALFLHYTLTDRYIYIFGIDEEETFLERKEKYPSFDETITSLYQKLRTQSADLKGIENKIQSLSEDLVEPIKDKILAKETLVIVPDGLLHLLPFDLLKLSQQDRSLIFDHNISYAYSGSTLLQLAKTKDPDRSNLLALAPEFNAPVQFVMRNNRTISIDDESQNLPSLKGAASEAKAIVNVLSGQILEGNNATESKFKKYAPKSGILHLATHAIIDDENPINSYMALAEPSGSSDDGKLYLWELNNLDLNAQMTVLSACDTGYGKLQEGEGMMSLGRAFIQAGSQSVIMSSWPAQDFSTKKIMIDFYNFLEAGHSKTSALRKAKLNYIEQADNNMNHPFFWSGFVVHGLDDPIQLSGSFSSPLKYLLFFGMGLLLLFALLKRK